MGDPPPEDDTQCPSAPPSPFDGPRSCCLHGTVTLPFRRLLGAVGYSGVSRLVSEEFGVFLEIVLLLTVSLIPLQADAVRSVT